MLFKAISPGDRQGQCQHRRPQRVFFSFFQLLLWQIREGRTDVERPYKVCKCLTLLHVDNLAGRKADGLGHNSDCARLRVIVAYSQGIRSP